MAFALLAAQGCSSPETVSSESAPDSAQAQDSPKSKAALTGVWDSSTSLGDINGDGNLDLVLTGVDANQNLVAKVYLGDGGGRFTEAGAGLTGVSDGSTSLGDIDGDGNLDLVLTGYGGDNAIAKVYLGDGSGDFTEAGTGLTGVRTSSSSLGDLNGDGHLDLVLTGAESPRGESPTAKAYLGDGNGGFEEAEAGLTAVSDGSTSLGDIDGDGHLDLVLTGADANDNPTAKVYLGDGSGGFKEAGADLTGVTGGSASLGDIDGDGHLDLVVTGYPATGNPMQRVLTGEVYLGDGSGGFEDVEAGLTAVTNSSTSLGDLNGDEILDLVLTGADVNDNLIAKAHFGDGSGDFTEIGAGLTGVNRGSTSLGDIDGDGNLDLVVTGTTATGRDAIDNPTATVYLGDGSGGFKEAGDK